MAWINVRDLPGRGLPTPQEMREVEGNIARRAKARFYADENFPTAAIDHLCELGAKVITAQEAGLRRHPDENHTAYALRTKAILVTCDRDYLNERLFPLISCPAVFVISFGTGTKQEIHRSFACLAYPLRAPQFYDKWCKVDASPDGWTEWRRYFNGTTSRERYRVRNGIMQQWSD